MAMFVLLEVAFSFGRHDHIWYVTWPEYKNRINLRSWHLSPLKPMPTGRVYWKAKSVAWICWNSRYWKSYDVITFLWRHSFFHNMNFNRSMLQILHLNALYPLAFVSLEKDISCMSLYSFSGLITWLTKYGLDYRNWRQSLIEETWPKIKPMILMDFKIWWLEVIHSNHFVVKSLPLNENSFKQG